MRVLVTGAGGLIGRTLVPLLQEQPELNVISIKGRAEIDLSDPESIEQLPEADAVIHLAGIVGVTPFDQDPLNSWKMNLLSTLHICEYSRRSQIQKLILASSYIYGPPQYRPIDELHPIAPTHAYQRSKYLSEQLCEQYAHNHSFQLQILRLFNIYGPDQDKNMLIPSILAQLNQAQIRLRDPHPRRDYIHVRDVANAFLAALTSNSPEAVNVYNIGSASSYSVAELLEILLTQCQQQPEVIWGHQRRPSDVDEVVADIAKARRELNWQPQIPLQEGLKELCAS